MAECKIVEKLVKFVPVLNDVLLMSVLRLLHNLSFDVSLRDDMVKHGLIPKVGLSAITLCAVCCAFVSKLRASRETVHQQRPQSSC